MSAEPTGDAPRPRAWAERAGAAWIVLVLLCWWLHFHANDLGWYHQLEPRVPALATFREAFGSLFFRPSAY